jgi:SAM-dependent methyltransferase
VSDASQQYDEIWEHVYGDMQESGPVHRHMKRLLRGILQTIDYRSVIDVGCGQGHNLPLLLEGRSMDRVTGIDISKPALERAGQRADADFHQLDVQQAALEGKWDLVFSALVLEHLPDDEAALRNMRRMAGRHVLITTIAGDFERYRAWDERMGHVRNYRVGELEQKLGRAGFKVERAVYWGFPFYSPIIRTLQNRTGTGTGKFGLAARLAAHALFWLYSLNSARRGDLLIIHAVAN